MKKVAVDIRLFILKKFRIFSPRAFCLVFPNIPVTSSLLSSSLLLVPISELKSPPITSMASFGHRSIIVCSSSNVSLKSSSLYFLSLHGMYVDITNSLVFFRNVSSNCNSSPTLRVVFATVCPRIGSGCPALFHASSAVCERTIPTPPFTCGFPSSFFFPFEKNRMIRTHK